MRKLSLFLLTWSLSLVGVFGLTMATRSARLIPAENVSVTSRTLFPLLHEPGRWDWTYAQAPAAAETVVAIALTRALPLAVLSVVVLSAFKRSLSAPGANGLVKAAGLGVVCSVLVWLPFIPIPNATDTGAKLFVASLDVMVIKGALIGIAVYAAALIARRLVKPAPNPPPRVAGPSRR